MNKAFSYTEVLKLLLWKMEKCDKNTSRIGTGLLNNVYGRNGSYVTAGQQDYAERMNQIQKQKEAYYKKVGVAPGVPTEKGAYGDPENTGVGYNAVLTELGNHDVPQGWIQTPHPNTTPGTNPGAPVSWNDPSNPDDPQAGYGYIPNDTTKEETFFYHSDHLGSTSYITDDHANITQYDAYLPYGELLVDEHSSSEDLPYKFSGKQFDEETGLYYYGARYYEPRLSLWMSVDPLECKHPEISTYCQANNNPIKYIDPDGLDNFIINEVSGEIIRQKTDGKTHSFYLSDGKSNVFVGAFEYNKKDLIGLSGRISFTNTKGESAAFAVKSGSENKSFISSNALAALIGAVGTVVFSDITINQFSYSDGRTPAPSVSYKDGKNGDLRYLRTDKSGSQTDVGSNNFDKQREQALTTALHKFGWKDMISEKYNNKLLPHTSSARDRGIRSNHPNHLHLQGFKPNIKTVEYINALPEVVVIGKRK